jgi:hypothetical protein
MDFSALVKSRSDDEDFQTGFIWWKVVPTSAPRVRRESLAGGSRVTATTERPGLTAARHHGGLHLVVVAGVALLALIPGSIGEAAASPSGVYAGTPASSCGLAPPVAAISNTLVGLGVSPISTALPTDLEEVSALYSMLCSDPVYTNLISQWGTSNLSLGISGDASAGPTFVNLSLNWATWENGVQHVHEEFLALNLARDSVSTPFNISTTEPSEYYNFPGDWAGSEYWSAATPSPLYDIITSTSVVSMSAEESEQGDVPGGLPYMDSDSSVWVGLAPQTGGRPASGGGNGLMQTGYAYDPSDPNANHCTGYKGGCSYGLWWEWLPGTAYPYSGNPAPSTYPGDLIGMSVVSPYTGYYETEISNEYGPPGQFWSELISTSSWIPYFGTYILEGQLNNTYSMPMQIPQFSNVEFGQAEMSAVPPGGSNLVPVSYDYSNNWYNTYQINTACASGNYVGQDCVGSNLNTRDSFVTGVGPEVVWVNSNYDWCYVNAGYNQQVNERCLPSGGGGCVAYGTPILTPQGYVPVQSLKAGDVVDEYNFSSQGLYQGAFEAGNTSNVTRLIDLNNGWLYLTPTEQPIYIRNSSYTGWLRDPQNLSTSDSIFNPVLNVWVSVSSVNLVHGQSVVFDVVTSGGNNFIANGALLDKKL